ncbi:MAG: hypothetical protein K2H64_01875 [Desulfovibrio sp.]|nr:hypothetical protein [Desulfovibrio sp.]
MTEFAKARKEVYRRLYRRFLDKDGLVIKAGELSVWGQENPLYERAVLYAKDKGHLAEQYLGEFRLTASGIDYYEKELLGE